MTTSKYYIVVFCLLSLPSALAEDRRTDKSRLSVMTINTLFMWDGVSPEEGSSSIQFPWKGDSDAARAHMAEIAQLIKATSPDVVNLVEVENLAALTLLNDTFLAGHGYEPSFVEGGDTFTGQDVCMLSRIDPEEFGRDDRTATSGSSTRGVTKNYFAKFDFEGKKIAFVGLHFLANPTSSSRRDARQAQAAVIKRKAHELADEGYSVIVLGDFNDYDGSHGFPVF
jgi:endonuclease/exonuclease/phosphatase family metal-dependent hydrolase